MRTADTTRRPRSGAPCGAEAGFTLIEALIAIMILIVGLAAVSNLFFVAASSNTVANMGTATTAQATEVLERLTATPFLTLSNAVGTAAGTVGNLDADVPATPCMDAPGNDCVGTAGTFQSYRDIPGVGRIRTRWIVTRPATRTNQSVLHIVVRSEAIPRLLQRRTRAELTTFRTCTAATCPF
jgi:type II secretory pathway pseudopilin PulG